MYSRPEQMRASAVVATDQAVGSSSPPAPPLAALGLGIVLSCAIAVIAEVLARYAPLIGAPILAIALGVVLSNLTGRLRLVHRLRVRTVSSWALRAGIVLLGFTLDLHDVLRTGGNSLAVLAVTMAAGLGFAFVVGRWLGTDWRVSALIGVGTTICGASAIAALAPVIRARGQEVGYAIAVIFLFNMLAVLVFPPIGHFIGLSDTGFGLWAGTAVNDTSAVVAAGFAYSHVAGAYATIVKLTRTTLIIPITLAFGLLMPWLSSEPSEREVRSRLAAVGVDPLVHRPVCRRLLPQQRGARRTSGADTGSCPVRACHRARRRRAAGPLARLCGGRSAAASARPGNVGSGGTHEPRDPGDHDAALGRLG